jgi:MFS family permease
MRIRNVTILSFAQALGLSGAPIVLLIGGLVGTELAPTPALSTLPVSVMVVGLALATIPASLLMKRIGRRRGFITGAILAGMAALLAAFALSRGSFLLFCLATLLIGSNTAFVQQYRFAAAESVRPQFVGRSVSLVLLGGVAAGFLGPEVGKRTMDWLSFGAYTGSFVSLAMLYIITALLLLFLREVSPAQEENTGIERPLREVAAQPTYLIAVLAGAVSYGVMSFIMTATPPMMGVIAGFSLAQTTLVIQSHIVAMYLPSLFTGFIVERLGMVKVMVTGVLLLLACVALGLVSTHFIHFWGALVLLGLGWNFLFVGGTVLLTRSYRPAERFKAQAANDFLIFGIQAFTSLSAGTVLFTANWQVLNLLNLPFLLAMLAVIYLWRRNLAIAPAGQAAAAD